MLGIFAVLVIVLFLILHSYFFVISYAIQKVKIEKPETRKIIVKLYKLSMSVYKGSIITIIALAFIALYKVLYSLFLNFSLSISSLFNRDSFAFSEYVALSISLVIMQPLTCLLIKASKKKWYTDTKQKEMRGLGTSVLNRWIMFIVNLPIKGFIHIVNLVLAIVVNSCKALNMDTSITSTSIYMSIATYYAFDKTVDYYAKRYSEFWEKLDNKLFNTKEIDSSINFNLEQLKNINERIYNHYIETGKFELTKN